MDIMLGGKLDGIETAEIRLSEQNIPIIYLTAYADDNTIKAAKITRPFGYILKPFDERELISTIELALLRHDFEQQAMSERRWLSAILQYTNDFVFGIDVTGKVVSLSDRVV